MVKTFGELAPRQSALLFTISCGRVSVDITNYGASVVSLRIDGLDVVLGYDDVSGYVQQGGYLGCIVGRNANRIAGSEFLLNGQQVRLTANEGPNCLHSGPDGYSHRLWELVSHSNNSLSLALHSPHGDQGFPGNADIAVTYTAENDGLTISYRALSDQDTVFNLTSHAYFNLFGENQPLRAMEQMLTIPGSHFCPDDAANIPTGELRPVEGTPFDFRSPKAIGRDIGADYEPLHLQGGYDHNFVNAGPLCAVLENPESGLKMTVTTDCPGVQVYSGNFLDNIGKGGVKYGWRSGVALETQFYPDALHHSDWPQPITRAGVPYCSTTRYAFE